MKFDWYQASVPDVPPEVVMDTLSRSEYYGQWQESTASKNYHVGAQFVIGDQVLYSINHGGQNAEHGANIKATGGAAPKLAEILKNSFPTHRISRVDSCEDYHHPDAYEYLRKKALKVASERKVKVKEYIKPLPESDDGRTLMLGSSESVVSLRIYEKGKQLNCGTDWVRAELQVRPQKMAKAIVANLSPLEIWGLSKWSLILAKQLTGSKLQRVDTEVYQPSDDDRAYHWLLKQFGNVLTRKMALHGSWETLGAQIGLDLENIHVQQPKASLKPVK